MVSDWTAEDFRIWAYGMFMALFGVSSYNAMLSLGLISGQWVGKVDALVFGVFAIPPLAALYLTRDVDDG